jgi:hypothetical protein
VPNGGILVGMAKFTRRIEPYAGKSANWKATLFKGEKVVTSRKLAGTYQAVNDALDRAQADFAGKKTRRKKGK